MEQATNDLRQEKTKLEKAERKLETAEHKLETAERKLEAAETNRDAQEFLSDKWKFFNEEVSRCSAMVTAMVTSTGAMALKLTPAPGTYSPPPHTRITHNPAPLHLCQTTPTGSYNHPFMLSSCLSYLAGWR